MTDHHLFAYGALMYGGDLHHELRGRAFLGGGSLAGALHAHPDGVCLAPGGDGRVFGELYAVSDADLARLDRVEGDGFRRERVRVRAGKDGPEVPAWVYLGGAASGPAIEGGRWSKPGGKWRGGTTWYFAYASNMWRMAERRKMDVVESVLGRIDNHRVANTTDAGDGVNGYGNVLPRRGDRVEGVLFRLHEEQVTTDLDVQEKVGVRMDRRTFAAVSARGERVFCEVYVTLRDKLVWGRPQHPANTTKILDGARESGLSASYQAYLEEVLRKPADPADYDPRETW